MIKTTTLCVALALALGLGCKNEKETTAESQEQPSGEGAKPAPKAATPDPTPAKATKSTAEATIAPSSGSTVKGTIKFEAAEAGVDIALHITGLTPGMHGLHLHETGDCSAADGKSAGGHYNPKKVDHGDPEADTHHLGDLGNVQADTEGMAMKTFTVSFISIAEGDANSVLGRAVIVHEKADDMKTQPTGAAGARVGCGVIALAE